MIRVSVIIFPQEVSNMRIICIIGSSAQETLMPLLHFRSEISRVILLAPKRYLEQTKYIQKFLYKKNRNSKHKCSCEIQIIQNNPEYSDFYKTVKAAFSKSLSKKDETVLNISGGSANMILAGIQAARELKVPVIYSDSKALNIQMIRWDDDGIHPDIHLYHININALSVKDILSLCSFYPSYLIQDVSLPGIQYERWVFTFFKSAQKNGAFGSIDRNLMLTMDAGTKKRSEFDIVFRKNRTIGFVSVKSGRYVNNNTNLRKTISDFEKINPERIPNFPCMRILISKYTIGPANKKRLTEKGILAFDNVSEDTDMQTAIQKIKDETDKINDSFEFFRTDRISGSDLLKTIERQV